MKCAWANGKVWFVWTGNHDAAMSVSKMTGSQASLVISGKKTLDTFPMRFTMWSDICGGVKQTPCIIWWISWTFHCSEEGVWLRVGTFEPNQSSYIWPNIAIFSDISYRKTISCNIIPKPKISCNIVWMEKIILLMVFFLKMYFRFLENTVPTWRYLINVIVLKRTRLLQHRNTLWSIVNQ